MLFSEMNKLDKMNEIRKITEMSISANPWFSKYECVNISEWCLGYRFSAEESAVSLSDCLSVYIPNWNEQLTASQHPNLANIELIWSLLLEVVENAEDSEDSEEVETGIVDTSDDNPISLVGFILNALQPEFSRNIQSVSVDLENPKSFTIVLK